LTLYLQHRFGIQSVVATTEKGAYTKPPTLHRFLSIASLLPLALATFIATSRVVDNKHFPADIVGGALVGSGMAWFAHNLWFV
jgi:hypothetical protein